MGRIIETESKSFGVVLPFDKLRTGSSLSMTPWGVRLASYFGFAQYDAVEATFGVYTKKSRTLLRTRDLNTI